MNIAVFGLGKLGSCIAAVLAQTNNVFGVDALEETARLIDAGQPPLNVSEPGLAELLASAHEMETLKAGRDVYRAVSQSDIAIIITPTPSQPNGLFDSTCVADVLNSITYCLKSQDAREKPFVVVIVSTLTPGSMMSLSSMAKMQLADAHSNGIVLLYSPVFVALGNVILNLCAPDAVLIGIGSEEERPYADLYRNLLVDSVFTKIVPVRVMTWIEAELAKLTLNVMLSVKALWANEIAMIAQAAEAQGAPILDFVGLDSRIGPKMLKPGFPPGGPCLPRDVRCLHALCTLLGESRGMLAALQRAREQQFFTIAEEVSLLGYGVKIGFVGFSYKPGTPVTEDSPSIHLAKRLLQQYGLYSLMYDIEAVLPDDLPEGIQSTDALMDVIIECPVVVIGVSDARYVKALAEIDLSNTVIYDVWGLLAETPHAGGFNYYRFGG